MQEIQLKSSLNIEQQLVAELWRGSLQSQMATYTLATPKLSDSISV